MSFIRALFSGVSGVKGHQTMMDVIGNNIANINTVGFKAGRATFAEQFAQTLSSATAPPGNTAGGGAIARGGTNPMQVGLGTTVGSIDNLFAQGTLQTTGQTTDLAVQGSGMFIVRSGDSNYYTRAGNFSIDGDGRFINPLTGGILQGRIADAFGNFPTGADIPGAELQDISINKAQAVAPHATSLVTFANNLDASALATNPDGSDHTVTITTPIYDSLGQKLSMTVIFTKTTSPSDGGPQVWNMNVLNATLDAPNDPNADENGQIVVDIGQDGDITFNEDGSINDIGFGNVAADGTITLDPIDFSGVGGDGGTFDANGGGMKLFIGTMNPNYDPGDTTTPRGPYDGITGFNGATSVAVRKQDGAGPGILDDFFIDQNGNLTGKFSNGTTQTLAQVLLAQFDNETGLQKVGDNLFATTGNSGSPVVNIAGVTSSSLIRGATVEQSNVDLTEEFTNLILAQRGFQANAKVITTSDELIQDLLNIKR